MRTAQHRRDDVTANAQVYLVRMTCLKLYHYRIRRKASYILNKPRTHKSLNSSNKQNIYININARIERHYDVVSMRPNLSCELQFIKKLRHNGAHTVYY